MIFTDSLKQWSCTANEHFHQGLYTEERHEMWKVRMALTKPRTPRISNAETYLILVGRAGHGPSEVHPIVRMHNLAMPHSANLHLIIPIHKWLFLCGRRKRHIRYRGPVVFVLLRHHERRPSRHEIARAIIMVVMVMSNQQMRRILVQVLAYPLDDEEALMLWRVDGHDRGPEIGN